MRVLKMILVIFFFSVLFGCTTATGSSILIGEARPAISPINVKIYLDPPSQYETIGLVEASGVVGFSRQETQDVVINELKIQAARIGANGILLINTGGQSGEVTGFYSNGIFFARASDRIVTQGRAIYVIQE